MTVIINGTTGISGVDGSAGTPAVQGSDTNTGVFYPAADTVGVSTGGTERMRIDSSGNVGIGTTSPIAQSQLTVASKSLSVTGSDGNFSAGGVRAMVDFAGGTQMRIGALDGGTATATTLAFLTSPGSAGGNERMRIDSSGNLLLNTTTVRNSARFTIDYNGASAQGLVLNNTDTGSASQLAMQFYRGATPSVVGQITTTNSATAYVTSSDYRLKENITPITGALAKVQALKPVTYKWKIDGSDSDGFIAHELAEVCPQAVYGEKDAVNSDGDIVPQGIDTSFLVATLTAAIQELKALTDMQASTITSLTARITALEAK
jgi:hypothetical protein